MSEPSRLERLLEGAIVKPAPSELPWDSPDVDMPSVIRAAIQKLKDAPPYRPPCLIHVVHPNEWRMARVFADQGAKGYYAMCANCFALVDLLAPVAKNP